MLSAWWDAHRLEIVIEVVVAVLVGLALLPEWCARVWSERQRKKRDGIL